MAVHTTADIPYDAVLILGVFGDFLYVLVARVAKERREILDHLCVIGSVRIVTTYAVILRGLVDKLKFFQFTLRHDVTGKAKLRGIADQQLRKVGTVRLVTHGALAHGGRAVKKCTTLRDFVTVVAKIGDRLGRQEELVVTAVRIMALCALAGFQRLMNVLLGRLLQMTVLTKVPAFSVKLKRMLLGIQRLMARFAVAKTDRPMNISLLGIVRVTFFRNARLLGRRGLFHRKTG
jgi:hypothetical protein